MVSCKHFGCQPGEFKNLIIQGIKESRNRRVCSSTFMMRLPINVGDCAIIFLNLFHWHNRCIQFIPKAAPAHTQNSFNADHSNYIIRIMNSFDSVKATVSSMENAISAQRLRSKRQVVQMFSRCLCLV